MMPLPPPLGAGGLIFWRLDQAAFAPTWNSGEGSFRFGGRWNSPGVRAVYAALDPSTAILEIAVHLGFKTLDTVAHVLSSAEILDLRRVRVVTLRDVPNPNWLRSGASSDGQLAFGDSLLRDNPFLLIPSVVSVHSWNLVFDPALAEGLYGAVAQEPFALDMRLHPSRRVPRL
jgi:RES domain-containing protein